MSVFSWLVVKLLRIFIWVFFGLAKISWFLVRLLIAPEVTVRRGNKAVHIRRDWNDRQIGKVRWSDLENARWDNVAGGTQIESRRPFVYAYVWCNRVQGDIAHSCSHGPPPHNIKVCIMKQDNSRDVWKRISKIVGPEKSVRKHR